MKDIEPMEFEKQWTQKGKIERDTPKFVKKDTLVRILGQTAPSEVNVDGRYGKRRMFVLNTSEYGLIYVTPLQFSAIVQAFKGNFNQFLDWKL